jgi:hypothetical protein
VILLLGIDDLPQIPVVLSEWTDYNPKCTSNVAQCFGLVCNQKTTQSYAEAIHAGHLKQSSITNGNECWRWT